MKTLLACCLFLLGFPACTLSPSLSPQIDVLKPVQTAANPLPPNPDDKQVPATQTPSVKEPLVSESPALSEPVSEASSAPVDESLPGPFQAVTQLVIDMPSNYLPSDAQALQLRVLLKDRQGKSLFLANPPFEYQSSHPQTISVSATGELTALQPFGFSEISVSLKGTALSAKASFSISQAGQGSGGGGGGGSSPPAGPSAEPKPATEKVQARIKFQF